ncbi:MAG: TatD family hydrolase [Candidatus Saccharibacteria bacterium]|nr:TatD family hydrolase [Candidatus Saccharibacteria bacterium]
MLIDSHCHIHDTDTYEFALSRVQKKEKPGVEYYTPEKLLARARENGIEKLICIGTDREDSLKARDFAESYEGVFWSYGIHPDESENYQINFEKGAIAIGEIGLDYRNGTKTRESQFKLLEEMLQLAKDNNLPCIFHVRDAFDDFFAVLRNFPEIKRAVVHSFSDSEENLGKCLNEGFYIGVNGLATFANIPLPPLDRILLETDSPFLAPVPHRGEVDEPAFVKNIANFLAIHYQTTFDNVAKTTTENAERLFKI